jgi:hypothetical protein
MVAQQISRGRMTNELNAAWVNNWKAAFAPHLRVKGRKSQVHDFWEGARACADLRKVGELETISLQNFNPDGPWERMQLAVEELTDEVAFYQTFTGKVALTNQKRTDAIKSFSGLIDAIAKARAELPAEYQWFGYRASKQLELDIKRMEESRFEVWERRNVIDMGKEQKSRQKDPEKEIGLDAQFQIRIAQIFRGYLPLAVERNGKKVRGVPRETIGRLVLNLYICAELCKEVDGALVYTRDLKKEVPRKLTLDAINQKLGSAGIK